MTKRQRRQQARDMLQDCGIPLGADFHSLGEHQLSPLVAWAYLSRYHKPQDDQRSRAECFLEQLQRRAA